MFTIFLDIPSLNLLHLVKILQTRKKEYAQRNIQHTAF